jgi:hypothetical protein
MGRRSSNPASSVRFRKLGDEELVMVFMVNFPYCKGCFEMLQTTSISIVDSPVNGCNDSWGML